MNVYVTGLSCSTVYGSSANLSDPLHSSYRIVKAEYVLPVRETAADILFNNRLAKWLNIYTFRFGFLQSDSHPIYLRLSLGFNW